MPKTSYYKMVDWWLFFSSNALAITMAFHTYLAYMCAKAKAGEDFPRDGSFLRTARFMTPASRVSAMNSRKVRNN